MNKLLIAALALGALFVVAGCGGPADEAPPKSATEGGNSKKFEDVPELSGGAAPTGGAAPSGGGAPSTSQ